MRIVCLVSKGASGKDFLFNKIKETDMFNCIITTTSRPMRPKEVDGVDYRFITREQFLKEISEKKFVEYSEFNGWFYGTSIDSFSEEKPNIIVLNPQGYFELQCIFSPDDVQGFYIDAPLPVRAYRYIKRDGKIKKELFRRLLSDRKDFKNIKLFYNMRVLSNYKDWEGNIKTIIKEVFKHGK